MAITAIEWLSTVIRHKRDLNLEDALQEALKMEREQIETAFYEGMQSYPFDPNEGRAELYFEQTYKNE